MGVKDARGPATAVGRLGWLLPLAALILVLWFEADVPNLPPLEQGIPLWTALGDSRKGLGLSGLLSLRSFIDVGARLAAAAATFAAAWLLVRLAPARLRAAVARTGQRIGNLPPRRYGSILFLAASLIPIAFFAFQRGLTPRLGDEIAYLFQSRLFSEGKLWLPAPEMRAFFKINLVVSGDRWFSQYPPGQPLFMMPAFLLGIPWVAGPFAGGVAAVATWLLGRRLYDERTGRIGGALAVVAPFFWFMSGSYFSHAACLAAVTLSALGMITAIQTRGRASILAALGGGAALGYAALTRPLTAPGLALGLGLLALIVGTDGRGIRESPGREKPAAGSGGLMHPGGLPRRLTRLIVILAIFAVGGAAVSAIAPIYNRATTGAPLTWGYEMAQQTSHALGFGQRGDLHIDFTPARALFNTRVRWRWLDGGFWTGRDPIPGQGFFYWPFPAIVVPLALLWGLKIRRNDLALGLVPVALAAAYFPYYYLDICWGPRFLYESAFALLLLMARGSLALAGMFDGITGRTGSGRGRAATGGAFVTALLAVSCGVGMLHAVSAGGELYDPVTWPTPGVDRALDAGLAEAGVQGGVVFIEGAGAFYETAWRRNFVDRQEGIIFARDLGRLDHRLVEQAGGPAWIAYFNQDVKKPRFLVRRLLSAERQSQSGDPRMKRPAATAGEENPSGAALSDRGGSGANPTERTQ